MKLFALIVGWTVMIGGALDLLGWLVCLIGDIQPRQINIGTHGVASIFAGLYALELAKRPTGYKR